MGSGERRERSGQTRRRRGSAVRYGEGSNMGLGHLRRRANIEEMMEKARNRIAKARASINAQEGGRRAHRAHTRKVAKKGLGGLPRNVKFMGFFTRKQAEKMLGRGH